MQQSFSKLDLHQPCDEFKGIVLIVIHHLERYIFWGYFNDILQDLVCVAFVLTIALIACNCIACNCLRYPIKYSWAYLRTFFRKSYKTFILVKRIQQQPFLENLRNFKIKEWTRCKIVRFNSFCFVLFESGITPIFTFHLVTHSTIFCHGKFLYFQ